MQSDLQPIHPEPTSFIRRYVFSTDHKVIAKQFLWLGLIWLAVGGVMAMLIRYQWAYPENGLISPAEYTGIFTMHGLIMIFFAITPALIGAFGNLCIPLMVGARDMAFPKLNMLSLWTFVLSLCLITASYLVDMGTAAAGWTTYPPISTNVGTPGWGQTLVVMAVFVTGSATIMGSINYVTTVIRLRAPGMGYMRMPLTVWGLFLTAVLNIVFVPVLAAAALLLTLDRVGGTEFFIAGAAAGSASPGDPLLFQHLFWIFGHPEVYILILPAWGIIGDILSVFSRKPAYWYAGQVWAMVAVTALSAVVYAHHMFLTGMSPLLGNGFMLLTLVISVPAELLFLNWLHTIWHGSIRFTTPMLFALGTVFVFGLGGLTGIYLGTISTDIYLHDTMFVVGHFHFTMAAATFLGTFAAIYYWFPKMFGKMMSEALGKVHYWGSVVTITLVFGGQMVVGYAGQQRRLFNPFEYTFIEHLRDANYWTSIAAFALGLFQLAFVVNFFGSLAVGRKASNNPWEAGTLEWTVSSPPVHHNFDVIPTVHRGPHEMGNPEVIEALGRDWIAQDEVFTPKPAAETAATA